MVMVELSQKNKKLLKMKTESNASWYDVDKYYGDDDIAKDVLKSKYLAPWEKSPGEMWERLAVGAASVEKGINQSGLFYELLSDFKFIPGGRINYGLGRTDINVSTSNCYVLANREDSLKGIYQFITEQGLTYAATGGVGTDISVLRPRGAKISRGGESPGAVSFMDLYSMNTNTIAQNGRRGACMLTIRVDHPDVEEFITIKSDHGRSKVKFANISILLTDEFLTAVEEGNSFDLRWGGKVWKTVDARELWAKITKHARDSAEPGLIFWDRMQEYHNLEHFPGHEIISTNPCFTGDTRIATQHGLIPISELANKKLPLQVTTDNRVHKNYEVIDSNDFYGSTIREAVPAYKTSDSEEVYRVETQQGFVVNTTKYHKFITPNGFIELKDMDVGDEILLQSGEGQWGTEGSEELGAVIGMIEGDGHWNGKRAIVEFWSEDKVLAKEYLEKCQSLIKQGNFENTREYSLSIQDVKSRDSKRIVSERLSQVLKEYGYHEKGRVPEVIWRGTRDCVKAYIKSLFACDGTINISGHKKTCSIRLAQSNIDLLRDVQCLLSNFGIVSKIYHRRKAGYRRLPDGKGGHKEYWCKDNFELCLAKVNLINFVNKIGLYHDRHIEKYNNFNKKRVTKPHKESFVDRIISIDYMGKETVYCTTQKETNSLIANGITIAQCGEQPLGDGASCNLGHVNVSKYCRLTNNLNNTERKYYFDWEEFEKDCGLAVRFMDNVLDWNDGRHATELQNKVCKEERRIGIGITGLADAMIYLGIRYDSDEGVQFSGEIMKRQCLAMYWASVELARVRGSFPLYNKELYFKSKFIQSLPEDLQLAIKAHGIRNSLLNTIAPVGTGSIIAQCSSGIEPVFALSYLRKVKDHNTVDGIKEYKVYHPLIKRLFGDDDNLPSHVVAAHQVNWENRVKLQGACQKWTDSAISSTINLPEEVSAEDVAKIYFSAWKQGLKGVTVYREGSREGILVTEKKEAKTDANANAKANAKAKAVERASMKRPRKLASETHKIKVDAGNGEIRNAYITISFFDKTKKPYEIFVNAPVKEDKDCQIMDLAARTTSMMLRHQVPMNFIIEQLEKVDNQFLYSIPTNLAKVLRQYVEYEDEDTSTEAIANILSSESMADVLATGNGQAEDIIIKYGEESTDVGAKVTGLDNCPMCKLRSLKYENGCKSCTSCGYDGCG